MTAHLPLRPVLALLCCAAAGLPLPLSAQALKPSAQLNRPAAAPQAQQTRTVDYIVALVNSEPITNFEVRQRLLRVEQQFTQQGVALPARDELQKQVLEQLVLERAQLQQAKAQGIRVDDATLAQAEQGIAAQNQLSVEDFRRRAAAEGLDINRLREELRNQILLQRLREREIESRVRVSETEIDDFLRERKGNNAADALELSLAHVLVQVPEGASEARVRELQAKAQGVVDRVRAGADFGAQAREFSDAPERINGGQFGMRPASRLPELFVDATRNLAPGGVVGPLRSPAGFHVLKLIEKRDAGQGLNVVQNHARHILLRLGPQLSQAQGLARLAQMRQQIVGGKATFEALARDNSQDGSASAGGDLGWSNPGQFVPEFEDVLNALSPGDVSQPLVSRFGVHLIKLDERRESQLSERAQRELARDQVREKKSDDALRSWAQELRGQAYVEFRDAPSL